MFSFKDLVGRKKSNIIVPAAACIQRGYVTMIVREDDGSIALDERRQKKIWNFRNAATTEGLNYLLGVGFNSVSQLTNWYFALINGSDFSAVSIADTMASHTGWAENVAYSQSNRPSWTVGTIANGSAPTGTAATYTINSATSVRGIAIVSDSTKSGTSGTLWATAIEGSNRNLANGQSLQVFYTNTITPVS